MHLVLGIPQQVAPLLQALADVAEILVGQPAGQHLGPVVAPIGVLAHPQRQADPAVETAEDLQEVGHDPGQHGEPAERRHHRQEL